MNTKLKGFGVLFILLIITVIIVYYLGPKVRVEVPTAELPSFDVPVGKLEQYISDKDEGLLVKKDNESKILWNDTVGSPTDYVLLYLHGFSASRREGYPIADNFAMKFGMNAYLPRLVGHGLENRNAMAEMTPRNLYNSAKESLLIAQKLGKKVIIMATSTGCSLALMLAADFPERVDGLILYSPNIAIKQSSARLLSGKWGRQIARVVFGGAYRYTSDFGTASCKYWTCVYPVEAVIYLQQLLDERMTPKEFAKVKAPLFLGLYYKDKEHQDNTISVSAAEKMFEQISTPSDKKELVYFPNACTHVIACDLFSKSLTEVQNATFQFGEDILKLKSK